MLSEQKELKLLQSEKQKIDLAIDNIMSAIERGVMSNNAIRRLNELEEQQLEYEKKIAIEKSKTVDLIPKAEIANYYKSALKLEPLLLINYPIIEFESSIYSLAVLHIPIKYNSSFNVSAYLTDDI